MPIALSEDHQELARVARSFLEGTGALGKARAMLDGPVETQVDYWSELGEMGWISLHLPESVGGQGATIEELVVILEELGRVVGAGAFLPTTTASAVIDERGDEELRQRLLPGLADGSVVATLGLTGSVQRTGNVVSGTAEVVPSASIAQLLLVAVGDDIAIVDLSSQGVQLVEVGQMDATRRVCDITLTDVEAIAVLPGATVTATRLFRALATAEAAGVAHATTEMAVAYAKVREQFGQIIGAFQAVKHHCANML